MSAIVEIDPDRENGLIEILLEPSRSYHEEWIPGEGSAVCLYRDDDDDRVVGVRLPLPDGAEVVVFE